ncbi:AMP-binding protein [Nocardia aobensis]|uniref:AMP-binding protein n=1 Tax=Nocardia aobensis TaxID=257277 RepID=UPI0002EA6AC3|nr:AMP-binding protein [Nocardia aobensis]
MRSLVDWITERDNDGTVRFYTGHEWESLGYDSMATEALNVAAALRERGIGRGDRVALVLPTCPEFPRYFFGVMAIGAIPTVVAPIGLPEGGRAGHLSRLRALAPAAVVAGPETLAGLTEAGADRPRHLIDAGEPVPVADRVALCPATDDETAIIQFTSGSSSLPRAVRISARAAIAHVEMLKSVFHDSTGHSTQTFGSWLPLHHDMGLIGTFLSPILYSQDAWLMRPEHFVRRPLTWLELFGRHGANHSAIPNFAIERIVRLVGPKALAGMDFSEWRSLIVGSDRINFAALRGFYELLAPFGLPARTVKPGYGMAETTLAVSVCPLPDVPTALDIDHRTLSDQAQVEVLGQRDLLDAEPVPDGATCIVSCGRALPGAHIEVVDSDRVVLPDGQVGEITVASPALFSGYLDEDDTVPVVHYTGDLGFRYQDEVYVLGRMGNAIKVNGTFITAEDVELALAERLRVHHDKITVVLRDLEMAGKPSSLVVFQQRVPAEAVETTLSVLRRSGLDAATAALVTMAPLAIPRTTSGKPRRVELWNDLATGISAARHLFVGAASPLLRLTLGAGHEPPGH